MGFTPLPESEDDAQPESVRQSFAPLDAAPRLRRGFTPIEPEAPSFGGFLAETLAPAAKTAHAMVDPFAVGETAAHLGTSVVAMPIAGIAGLGAAAANALGADVNPANVVERTAHALTYAPKTERGAHLARAAMYPFEKLQEGARYLGEKAQDITGSAGAATGVETAIAGGLPLMIPGTIRALTRDRSRPTGPTRADQPEASQRVTEPVPTEPDIPFAREPSETPGRIADQDLRRPVDTAEQALTETLIADEARRGANEQAQQAAAEAPREPQPPAPRPPAERVVPEPPTQAAEAPRAPRIAEEQPVVERPTATDALDRMFAEQERLRDAEVERLLQEVRDEPTNPSTTEPTITAQKGAQPLPEAPAVPETAEARILDRHPGEMTEWALQLLAEQGAPETAQAARAEIARRAAGGEVRPPEPRSEAGGGTSGKVISLPKAYRPKNEWKYVTLFWPTEFGDTIRRLDLVDVELSPKLQGDGLYIVKIGDKPELRRVQPLFDGNVRLTVDGVPGVEIVPKDALDVVGRVEDVWRAHDLGRKPGFNTLTHEMGVPSSGNVTQLTRLPGKNSHIVQWQRGGMGDTIRPLDYLAFEATPKLGGDGIYLIEIGDAAEIRRVQHLGDGMVRVGVDGSSYTDTVPADKLSVFGEVTRVWHRQDGRRPAVPTAPDGLPTSGEPLPAGSGRLSVVQKRGFTPLAETPEAMEIPPEASAVRRSGSEMAGAEVGHRVPAREALEAPDGVASMTPGAQYTGMLNDATITNPAPRRAEPIRREDVLAPLLEALKTPIYEGRVQGKARGWYLPKREAVRIRNKSDLEVTAHELAHLIDDRVFNGFGKQKGVPNTRPWIGDGPEAKTFANELRSVSYNQHKVFEGFAEFVRLYMTQPEKARAAAPNFSMWFDGFVDRHEYGPALKEALQGMLDWFGQDALDRARSKIGEQPDVNRFKSGVWDRFRQATVDDLHGVYRMERELKGAIVPLGAYETARLTRASGAMTDGAIRYGSPYVEADGSVRWVGKGLEQILEPVSKSPDQLNDFLLYAVGRSAKELKSQGREHLFTDTEINAMVGLEAPEFRKAMTEYQFWNKRILDFAEAKGLINPYARRAWQRAQYIPFHRVGTVVQKAQGGVTGNWSGIKTLTGGTENIRDVLGNIIGNAHMLIDAALKNEARAKVVDLAEKTQGGGRFLTPIPPEKYPVKVERAQVKEKLIEAAGGNPHNPPPQLEAMVDQLLANAPYLMEFLVKGAPTGNVIAVLRQGKPRYYEVADPILYRAVASLNRPAQSALIKWLAIPKRIGQASITLTPDFAVANIARDTLMGAVTSRAGFIPAIDSIRGFVGRLRDDPSHREYLANGGGFASYLVDENAFRAHLDRFYSEKGFNAKTVLDTPDKFLYFFERLFDAFETSTRLGEYKRLRSDGVHPRHAAYLSREVSTDFAMKGDNPTLNALYDTVMFLRPAAVSLDRIYRGLAHDPNKGAIAAKAGALAVASAALYMQNRDNPKFQDLPDWERDSYWHFFMPGPDGGDLHFRYPKIWEIGALGTLAERTVERILENEPKELARDFGRVLKQQFVLNMMPQAIAPLVELARNKDSFTGRPIEAQSLENLQPFLRAKIGTSETMRTLGMASRNLPEALQFNPVRAEHLLTGYLNTWAMYGLMLSDAALFSDRLPQRRPDDYPVIRRFYRSEPQIATKYEDIFQEMYEEAHRLRSTLRELDRQGRRGIADEIERAPVASRAAQLQRVQQRLAAIRHEAAAVRVANLPPNEKRARFDALTVERTALLKAAVGDLKRSGAEEAGAAR